MLFYIEGHADTPNTLHLTSERVVVSIIKKKFKECNLKHKTNRRNSE